MIVRKWDWFIPIIPPSRALIAAMIMINLDAVSCRINERIISGASFCHVARIVHASQDIAVITDGNQKWNGAIPSLSKIADSKIKFINGIDLVDQWAILVISIILEPSAWAIKYLIAASVSWFDFELVIRGINLNMLISIAIHRKIQFVLDIAIIVLIISEDTVRRINGLFI